MPDPIETDPAKGFVAFPMSVFELDLTPGAFRTLAELCRMANPEGRCWPSLAQLGDRLGRSRAAISGYIAELREAGLIDTETQRMANGFNYRLRYRVVFWKEWRSQLGQRVERRVRPAERPLETKNHNQENQSRAAAADLIRDWKKCVGKAPYPAFEHWPSERLLAETTDAKVAKQIISADIIAAYQSFLSRKGVENAVISSDIRSLLTRTPRDDCAVAAFIEALERHWKPHWRNPPVLAQVQRILRQMPAQDNPAAQGKLLASYVKRWEIHAQSLSLAGRSSNVAA